jgi:hypothetical protein
VEANIIFIRHLYHFDNDPILDILLDETTNGVSEINKNNTVLYDDEMNNALVNYKNIGNLILIVSRHYCILNV